MEAIIYTHKPSYEYSIPGITHPFKIPSISSRPPSLHHIENTVTQIERARMSNGLPFISDPWTTSAVLQLDDNLWYRVQPMRVVIRECEVLRSTGRRKCLKSV